jgi:hypothetical protein
MAARRAPPTSSRAAPAREHLISRAEMARRLGISRPAITKACRDGGRLAPACKGNSINVLHEAAQRWLVDRAGNLDGEGDATLPRPNESQLEHAQRIVAKSRARQPEPELVEAPPAPVARAQRRRPAPAPDPIELEPIEVDGDEPEAARSIEDLEAELGPREWTDLGELAEPLTVLSERYGNAKHFEGWIRARKALEEARKAQMLRERIEGRLIARTTVVRAFDHVDTAFRLLLSDAPRAIATRIAPQDVATVAALVRDVMSQHLDACKGKIDLSLASDDPLAPLAEAAE